MKKNRFSEKQIFVILKEAQAGMKTSDLCHKPGISNWTFYQWRSKCGGMDVGDACRLKAFEDENRKLRRLIAYQSLDIVVL